MKDFILQCNNIKKSFQIGKKKLEVLKGISLDLERSQWLMLLGASGSGKTTLLNILGTLEQPNSGSLKFDGRNYTEYNPTRLRNEKIGFVFQSYHLLPELNVLENVMLPAQLGGDYSLKKRAIELIERVGLKDRAHHRPTELSGGECQRAAIARALINRPELLLADEPTGNLDTATGHEIMELFRELHRDQKSPLSIIMITHNPDLAHSYGTRSLTISDGRIAPEN
ncbi:MAG: ABC transporter ATP-binding protein [Victivallaceae bacterium]